MNALRSHLQKCAATILRHILDAAEDRLAGAHPPTVVNDTDDLTGLGSAVIDFHIRRRDWATRRVERVELQDDRIMRRMVSVDYTLGDDPPVDAAGRALLPLAVLRKAPLSNFDMRDDAGRSLSVLRTSENGRLVAEGMLDWLHSILGQAVPQDIQRAVNNLVVAAPDDAHLEEQQLAQAVAALTPAGTDTQRAFDVWFKIVSDFADGFLLVVRVPLSKPSGVVKYSYDEAFGLGSGSVADRLGWRPASIDIEVPSAGDVGSYHFESTLPAGIGSAESRMHIDPETGESMAIAPDADSPHVHFHLTNPEPGSYFVRLELVPRPRVFLNVAVLTSLLGAAVMAGGWFAMAYLSFPGDDGGGAPAAQLLSLTALAASLLLRSAEHPLLGRIQQGPRVMAWVTPLLSFFLAATLLVPMSDTVLREIWRSSAAASLGFGIAIWLAGRSSETVA